MKSIGIDVNPLLVGWSNFLVKTGKLKNCRFIRENIFAFNYAKADSEIKKRAKKRIHYYISCFQNKMSSFSIEKCKRRKTF